MPFITASPGSPLGKAIDWVADKLGLFSFKSTAKAYAAGGENAARKEIHDRAMQTADRMIMLGMIYDGAQGPIMEQPAPSGVNNEWKGPVDYTSLKDPKNVGESKDFTPAQLKAAKELNMQKNNGVLKSDIDGQPMNPSKQAKKGEKADMKQVEGDHIKAKAKKGTNGNENLQLITKKQNLNKHTN